MSTMKYEDLEMGGGAFYPGQVYEDQIVRWGFLRKVYGILSTQMILTTLVASVVVFSEPVKMFFARSPFLLILLAFLPLILLCPLYYYHQSHPTNLVLLGLFTVGISLTVGISCAFTPGIIVLEALLLTATVVLGLTAYTYYAVKQGKDFEFLGPALFVSVIVLVVFGLVQLFFPLGDIGNAIYGGLGALIFSLYIVYDTDNLIKRYSVDEYIWASVALYLDIINLFLSLLQLWPGKFQNKTNGVTPRRWLRFCNPELSRVITKWLGSEDWVLDTQKLSGLRKYADDRDLHREWFQAKKANKIKLAAYVKEKTGYTINADALFDIQVKRIHEYKRQLLNILGVIHRYKRMKEMSPKERREKFVPRVSMIGGKAFATYTQAKRIVKLITDVAATVNNDSDICDLMKIGHRIIAPFLVWLFRAFHPSSVWHSNFVWHGV